MTADRAPEGLSEHVKCRCGHAIDQHDDLGCVGWHTWVKRAPRNFGSPQDFDARFVAYLAGRASRAEHGLRALTPASSGEVERRGSGATRRNRGRLSAYSLTSRWHSGA